jgi:hypothetical protein
MHVRSLTASCLAEPSRRAPRQRLPHRCRAGGAEALLDGDQVPRGQRPDPSVAACHEIGRLLDLSHVSWRTCVVDLLAEHKTGNRLHRPIWCGCWRVLAESVRADQQQEQEACDSEPNLVSAGVGRSSHRHRVAGGDGQQRQHVGGRQDEDPEDEQCRCRGVGHDSSATGDGLLHGDNARDERHP